MFLLIKYMPEFRGYVISYKQQQCKTGSSNRYPVYLIYLFVDIYPFVDIYAFAVHDQASSKPYRGWTRIWIRGLCPMGKLFVKTWSGVGVQGLLGTERVRLTAGLLMLQGTTVILRM